MGKVCGTPFRTGVQIAVLGCLGVCPHRWRNSWLSGGVLEGSEAEGEEDVGVVVNYEDDSELLEFIK